MTFSVIENIHCILIICFEENDNFYYTFTVNIQCYRKLKKKFENEIEFKIWIINNYKCTLIGIKKMKYRFQIARQGMCTYNVVVVFVFFNIYVYNFKINRYM